MEKPLTHNIHPGREPLDLAGYERGGGYQAIRKALREMTPKSLAEEVKNSNLRGRGGAGFSTALKWSFVPQGSDSPTPKHVVVNADEMEPGTFKDRLLMEGDPHQLLEGVMIAAYANHAEDNYIFLRWEYRLAARRLQKALDEAYGKGYLGQKIFGSDFSMDLRLHISGGRYMCGEETGLINALEGKRSNPRAKPPFPPIVGAFGNPTVIQNVETICNLPHIVNHGAQWFRALSKSEDGGTKLYGASGKVKRPGIWELPMGTTVRELLYDHAGGMRDGLQFRGLLPGGASTDFLIEEHLDLKMDFDGLQKAGSRMGTGTMIVLDDQTCPVGMTLSLERFFARESCGWCTPCREGLPWVEKLLAAIERGQGEMNDLQILQEHCKHLGMGMTFCALAPGAMEPLQSALKYFREDFERHITEKRCPWR